MTRMPSRLHPRPGETLHGYAARFSKTLDRPLGAILDGLGLLPGERRGWGCLLTEAQAAEVGDALGLVAEQVHALTLRSYEPLLTMPTEVQRRSLGGWAAGEWVLLRGGRYCPLDLREQLPWQLSWRLPEQIGCLSHDVLLAHLCPGCGGPASVGGGARAEVGFMDFVHDPQRCFSPARTDRRRTGRAAVPCGHDLASTEVRSLTTRERSVASLVARMHADQEVLLLGESVPPPAARQLLREALSLQVGADQREQTSSGSRTRLYRQPISDPARVSDLLERTGDWLFATDRAAADKALTNWIGIISGDATPNWALFARSLGTAPALEPYLRRSLRHFGRPSLRASRHRSHQMPEATPYLERLPQLAWACALPQDLRLSTEPAVPFLQVAFSMQLARQSTTSWARAAALLALPGEAPGWVKYVYDRLQREGLRDRFIEQVQSVHEQLLGQSSWRSHTNPVPHLRLPPLTEGQCAREGAPWCPCLGVALDLQLNGERSGAMEFVLPWRPQERADQK